MKHECERCGYTTTAKSSLVAHLNKQKVCNPVLKDVCRSELLSKLNSKDSLVCEICGETFKNASAKCRHKKKCLVSPSRLTDLAAKVAALEEELKAIKMNKNNEDVVDNYGFLYIVHLREHINLNANTYKIGRSKDVLKRFSRYPKQSELLFTDGLKNYMDAETELKRILRNDPSVKYRDDLGTEYFECDLKYLKKKMYEVIEIFDKL